MEYLITKKKHFFSYKKKIEVKKCHKHTVKGLFLNRMQFVLPFYDENRKGIINFKLAYKIPNFLG